MAAITYDRATVQYPGAERPSVNALDLEIADGEFLVLVGPSGCGKSTSLRALAGLEAVSDGSIRIGDKDVTHLPPKERDIAMVFQNYALYPHMTVADNMGFALKISGMKKEEIAQAGRGGREDPRPRPSTWTASPRPSPVVSASGWPWAGRSCATRRRS